MRRSGVVAGLPVLLVALGLAAAPAWAQSKRYPPEPVDKDEEAAQRSELWDHATNPRQAPYVALVKQAQRLLAQRTPDATRDAIARLDEAVRLVPDEIDAYRVRGEAHVELHDWARCSADLQTAWTRLRKDLEATDTDARETIELRKKLGLCQARAGKLADAERTLAEAAATGINSVELWMRLGEVRIAMGKLEEAIAALEASIEQTDIPQQALARWLLAGAFDRARRPSEAVDAARRALASDRNLGTLKHPTLPLLGTGEAEYLLGLAYEAHDPPRPELALIYFRRFLDLAVDSPWRRRAEDHVKELKTAQLPDAVERTSGNAPLDDKLARTPVRRAMPAMRACLAKHPQTVVRITITRVGPRTPDTARDRPRYHAPPAGAVVELDESLAPLARAEIDAVIRCLEPLAARIPLPAIKERDAYYKVQFRVVGP